MAWLIKKKEINELPRQQTLNHDTIVYVPQSFHCCSLLDKFSLF